METVILVSGK